MMNILVADDDPMQSCLFAALLSDYGHKVVTVADGNKAWEELQCLPFDLVITDWLMPGLNGLDLLRRIRATHFENYVYVILCSSRDSLVESGEALRCGADDFLVKPVSEEDLQARLAGAQRATGQE